MSVMTATADPATGSVLLEITKSATVHKVLRNSDNGIAEVRALPGQLPSTGPGQLILTDYEAAAGMNTYTLIDDEAGAAAVAVLDVPLPWLMVPVMPHYARQVQTVTGYSSARASLGAVHTRPGAAAPVVNLAPLALRTGQMELWAASLREARDLEAVFDRGEIVMLKQRVPGMDMYFTATATSIQPSSPQGEELTRWRLNVTYAEVDRPAGALAGALGWTFDALAAAYGSFDAVAVSYASFDDLTVNRAAEQ